MENIEISTSDKRLDIKMIHTFLSNSYWGKGRTLEEVRHSIKTSTNFGLYKKGNQIGYARVVTDEVFFAYLMDVFIIPSESGKGYGKLLMKYILDESHLQKVKTWRLNTADAHNFYATFGFIPSEEHAVAMVRKADRLENTAH